MKHISHCAIILVASLACEASATAGLYALNNLGAGNLVGQDNWLFYPATSAARLQVFKINGGPNQAIRHTGTPGQIAYRLNDATYTFPPFANNETNATMYADFRVNFVGSGQYNALFGVAADSGDAGSEINVSAEVSPYFGLIKSSSTNNELAFVVRAAGDGTIFHAPVAGHADEGDWVRLKFSMNFVAGTASLSLRNLTRHSDVYTALPSCTDVAISLDRMSPECPPSAWNAMYVRMTSNLSSADAPGALAMANLVAHANGNFLPTEISKLVPPSWLRITLDRLAVGETYRVESQEEGDSLWQEERTFVAESEAGVIELPVTPASYSNRLFRAVLIP